MNRALIVEDPAQGLAQTLFVGLRHRSGIESACRGPVTP